MPPEQVVEEKKPDAGQAPAEPNAEQKRIAELEASSKKLLEEREQARGYAYALTQRLAAQEQQAKQSQTQVDPEERTQRVKQALDDDPEGTLDAHFQQRVAPLMQNQYRTLAQINKDQFVKGIDPRHWQKYGPEVEQFVKDFSPETMAEKDAWQNAYNFVRMNHIDEIVEERLRERAEEQNKKNLLESGASGAAASTAPKIITGTEKAVMEAFGMDEKEWRKYGSTNLTQAEASSQE